MVGSFSLSLNMSNMKSKNYIKVYLKKIIKIFYLIYIIIISKFKNNSKNIYIIGGLTFDKITFLPDDIYTSKFQIYCFFV